MAKDQDAELSAMLSEAMIGTEKEIFGEAFGQESTSHDDTGDRSLEEMGSGLEGQHEPEDDETEGADEGQENPEAEAKSDDAKTEAEGKAKAEPEAKVDDRQDERGRVPPGRLREQTERTRAVEAERDAMKVRFDEMQATHSRQIAESNARMDAILAAMKVQQPQPKAEEAKPDLRPDLFENPNAFADHMQKGVQSELAALRNEMREQRINTSMEYARSRHGEAFDNAWKSLTTLDRSNPDNQSLVQRLTSMPNPGEAVVSWHKRNEALREIGDDPAAYKARAAEDARKALSSDPEFRRQLIAELRGEAETGDNGRPRSEVRLPPSLQRAAGGNGRSPDDRAQFDGSESAIFNSAFL